MESDTDAASVLRHRHVEEHVSKEEEPRRVLPENEATPIEEAEDEWHKIRAALPPQISGRYEFCASE